MTSTHGSPPLRDGIPAAHVAILESDLDEFEDVSHGGSIEAPERTLLVVRQFIETAESLPSPK